MIKQIRICGLGGQGVVFTGSILGKAAVLDGKWVSGANAYGSQARGGVTSSDIVISDQPIKFPHVIECDILVALSLSAFEAQVNSVKKDNGIIYYDRSLFELDPEQGANAVGLDLTGQALDQLGNKKTVNMVSLGAVNFLSKIVSDESVRKVLQQDLPIQQQELNLKAYDLGIRIGEAANEC